MTKYNPTKNRICAALLCLALMLGIFPASVSAAKERFMNITRAGVTDLDAPVAGKKGDYTASAVDAGKYEVSGIEWYETATNKMMAGTETFKYDTEYYAIITIKTKSAYTFSHNAQKQTTVAVSCNEDSAMALTLDPDKVSSEIGIKVFFPKTGKNPNPEQGTPGNIISSIGIVGLTEPKTGEAPSYLFDGYSHTSYTRDSDYNDEYYVNGLCWSYDGGRSLKRSGETFDPGEEYRVTLRIVPKAGYKFAVNASGDTAMTAKINGKTAEIKGNASNAILTYTFARTARDAITEAAVTEIEPPIAGQKPDYTASYGDAGYAAANQNDASTKNGIYWYNETDKKPMSTSAVFEAG
ncbi:MAG: hypothetical protein IJY35_03775, partial [Clostridia bacterium]|nr:hypothetical protein [Clostridia bacterium]